MAFFSAPGHSSLTVTVTLSDGRRRARRGQAEWENWLNSPATGVTARITVYPPPAAENPAVIRLPVAASMLGKRGGQSLRSGGFCRM
jgi:hypothetical protein